MKTEQFSFFQPKHFVQVYLHVLNFAYVKMCSLNSSTGNLLKLIDLIKNS